MFWIRKTEQQSENNILAIGATFVSNIKRILANQWTSIPPEIIGKLERE